MLCGLIFHLVSLLEPLHSPHGVNYSLFAGIEWVAFATYLDLKFWLSRANGESITTKTSYFSIIIILRMNFGFHDKRLPSFYI